MVEQNPETVAEVLTFIRLRFENEQVAGGLPQELVEAATSVGCDDLLDTLARIDALDRIRTQEISRCWPARSSASATSSRTTGETVVRAELFSEAAERDCLRHLGAVRDRALPLVRTAPTWRPCPRCSP